jgi:thimet oligopeptidase
MASTLLRYIRTRPTALLAAIPRTGMAVLADIPRAGMAVLLAAMPLASVAAPAEADPFEAAAHGAPSFLRACRALPDGAASPAAAATRERWRNAADLLADVHPDPAVRDASRACEAAPERPPAAAGGAHAASRPGAAPAAIPAMEARLARLERDFQRRLSDRDTRLRMTQAEVAGLPAEWLAQHRVGRTTTYEAGVGLADYHLFMQMADDQGARRRMYFAHGNRGGLANVRTLQQIVDLRRAIARARGRPSHYASLAGEYGLPPTDEVRAFVASLQAAVDPAAADDVRALEALVHRGADGVSAGPVEASVPLRRWDVERLLEVARERVVGQGDTEAASRLPAALMRPWLQAYFGRLAQVGFGPAVPAAWSGAASCLPVHRLPEGGASEPPSGSGLRPDPSPADSPGSGRRPDPSQAALGLLCLDTAPRPGKYYNYATHYVPEAGAQPRMAVIVANLEGDALVPDEVERMFAEFSVALAYLACDGATCPARTDGLGVWSLAQRGFFGPLAFTEESLQVLRETAPQEAPFAGDTAEGIRAAGAFASGLQYSRQLELARFDFELAAASGPVDVMARWRALEKATPFGYEPGTFYPSRLNMVAGPTGGSYYTALWTQAASLALRQRYAGHTLDPEVAPRLRAAFFEPAAGEGQGGGSTGRMDALLGPGLSSEPLARLIEQNTISAVGARLRQAGLPAADRR